MSTVAATLFLQATETSIFTNLSRRARGLQPDAVGATQCTCKRPNEGFEYSSICKVSKAKGILTNNADPI